MPREENTLADELTNEDFSHFRSENRVSINIDATAFPVLFDMLAQGRALFDTLEQLKLHNKGAKRKWPKVAENRRLRFSDPW